jgi:hypothetical protein
MTAGIKESLEFLDGIKVVGVTVADILKDGKVNLADLPKLLPLLQNVSVLVEAAKGVKEIPAEAKDLSEAELIQLGAKVFEIVRAIKG